MSVVVPVYNAAEYLPRAVDSALNQTETGEVVLVEDGSTDGSLDVCERLSRENDRVRLFTHPEPRNRGPGASRNRAIRAARYDLVAFLDADDYYLPGRMSVACRVLADRPEVDGVYEAVEADFESDRGAELWDAKRGPRLKAAPYPVSPNILFEAMLFAGYAGFVHTNGWTVRRSLFQKTDLFDENLLLGQDHAMWIKFAAMGAMLPGRQDRPVAVRRVYDENRSLVACPETAYQAKCLMWRTLWKWGREKLALRRHQMLLMRLVDCLLAPPTRGPGSRPEMLKHILRTLSTEPRLGLETYFWRQSQRHMRKHRFG